MDATDGPNRVTSPGDTGVFCLTQTLGCAGGRQPTGHVGAGGGWHCVDTEEFFQTWGTTHTLMVLEQGQKWTPACVIWAAAG